MGICGVFIGFLQQTPPRHSERSFRVKSTQYENDMMEEREFNSKIKTAERKGKAEGLKEQAIQSAQTMLKDNVPIDLICKYTGLTKEEVLDIQQQ